MKEFYKEVKCDYNNEEGFWCVDAWRTSNDNEEGKVVAVISDKTGDVFYCEPEARLSPKVAEAIRDVATPIKEKARKVWVIHFDDVNDYATLTHEIEAFANYDDAKKRFDNIVADAKKLLSEGGNDDWEVEESETSYSTWPDGEWGTSHYSVELTEVHVQ